ncbi:MAG: 30S ribosomal protein S6e [Candidatus Woesearchaeota archaeon]|nr:MAG: 30S ribosomal protein S6e [Candidatus Woesearchaeota archaeon]
MAEVKLVLGSKTGKSYQAVSNLDSFLNKKIGDKLTNLEGFSGYEFEIKGGSDTSGFPMRRDIEGPGRRKPLLTSGAGVKIENRGEKRRKTIRGNTISLDTAQINLKVLTEGKKSLEEMFGKKEAVPAQVKE